MLVQVKRKLIYIFILILSIIFNVAVKVIPFNKIISIMTNSKMCLLEQLTDIQNVKLNDINNMIIKISNVVPWRVMCFESALIFLTFCRIYKTNMTIYFGVSYDNNNKLIAHAWTSCNDVKYTGAMEASDFKVVYNLSYKP